MHGEEKCNLSDVKVKVKVNYQGMYYVKVKVLHMWYNISTGMYYY